MTASKSILHRTPQVSEARIPLIAALQSRLATSRRLARDGVKALFAPAVKIDSLDLDMRAPIVAGLSLIAVGFGGFLLWAAFAPLHSAVLATGYVAVESQRKVVQHLEGGIVGNVHVGEGAEVDAGDLLISLDARRAEARKSQLEIRLFTLGAEKGRLEAELAEAPAITVGPLLAARSEDPRLVSALKLQEELMHNRRDGRGHRAAGLDTQSAQALEEINGLQAQQEGRRARLTLLNERLDGMRQLAGAGHVSRAQIAELEGELATLNGELGDLAARIAGAHQKFEQVAEEFNALDNAWRTEAADRLQAVERDFAETWEALQDSEDVIRRSEIRSPSAGTVQDLKVHTAGAVIGAGMPLMEIVPREDALVIEGNLRPEDIDSVYRGQPVHVRLSAFSFRRTPPVEGTLTELSADRIVDPRTGYSSYRIVATLDQNSLAALDGVALKAGMPADVMIVQTQRTLLDYLIDPIVQVTERAFREQ
ncbi:MAG TPA: HlyD family type I secretion periplasmic adaptor subunit [Saliniramus sp.]|nr:HlyD family type I secretion periplasmic adaptor subunit [Saliniramus sp.]